MDSPLPSPPPPGAVPNATPPAASISDPARIHFHILLGATLCPPFSVALGIMFLVYNLAIDLPGRRQRLWLRRLGALLAVDLAVVLALVVVIVHQVSSNPNGVLGPSTLRGPVGRVELPRSLIGILFTGTGDDEPIVKEVLPGWPADRAGMKTGDRIVAVDDAPMATVDEVRKRFLSIEPGTQLGLRVMRGGETVDLIVTPRPTQTGLFTPAPEYAPGFASTGLRIWEGLFILLVIVGVTVYVRRRGRPGTRVWPGFVIALLGSGVFYAGGLLASKSVLGGWTLGGTLIAMGTWSASLLGLAFAVLRIGAKPRTTGGADVPPVNGFLIGILYLIGGMIRINLLLNAVGLLLTGRLGVPDNPVETLTQLHLGVTGKALLVLSVVLLGPVAEELLFRGVLFPRLWARTGPHVAAWVSAAVFAVLHLHYGIFVLSMVYCGLVLAWVRYRTGGLLAPVLLHMGLNGMTTLIILAMSP